MTVLDFAALPPEINSGRMYSGAGSGPLLSAATAWDGLAAELCSAKVSYRMMLSDLTDRWWSGPAATSMTATVAPYLDWMDATVTRAEQTASQARVAAGAYEAAFAATVPPPVVTANRMSLAILVATNFLGQNTPAIAANEAQYAEMWAQDAAAMYGYAANSMIATELTPFIPPPKGANSAASVDQPAGTQSADGGLSDLLQTLIELPTEFLTSPLMNQWNNLNVVTGLPAVLFAGPIFASLSFEALVGPLMVAGLAFPPFATTVSAHGMPDGALGSTLVAREPTVGGAKVSVGVGRGALAGRLSVPQSWTAAAEGTRVAGTTSLAAGSIAMPEVGPPATSRWLGGMPALSAVNTAGNSEKTSQYNPRFKMRTAVPGPIGRASDSAGQETQLAGRASDIASTLTERERAEFNRLREEVAEMATECDAMTVLMEEAYRP